MIEERHWLGVLLVGSLVLAGCADGVESDAEPTSTSRITTPTSEPPAASTSSVPILATSLPSQRPEHAERDGVRPEVAALSYSQRVDALVEVDAVEGVWTLSRIPRDAIDFAPTLVNPSEYGEIVLVDASNQIVRAYPMPGAIPSWIVLTDASVYAGRVGDGGLPDSTLVVIDRATLDVDVLLIPAPFDGGTQWPVDWVIATPEQARIYEDAVGFAPDGAEGTPAASWIGEVVVDIDAVDSLVGRFGDCPDRPRGSSPALFDDAAGTYAASIESFDAESLVLSFDVVQWVSGQDAVDAYHEEFPDDPDGPPNDYWVRNDSPTVRDAPADPGAEVLLVRLQTDSSADVSAGTLAELPEYLTETPFSLYWLTFDTGTIVAICEQYTP